ncbi:MAG: hypothetical protein JNM93_05605 [Bacteriovoracaceae bacterium]|nr:hypothetical protein [Bacteriovoracaceae bacterium]
MMIRVLLILGALSSIKIYAQQNNVKMNPCQVALSTETVDPFLKLSSSQICLQYRFAELVTENARYDWKQLKAEGRAEIIKRELKQVMQVRVAPYFPGLFSSYQMAKEKCAKEDPETTTYNCKNFVIQSLDHPIIYRGFFYPLVMFGTLKDIKNWVENMPYYDLNKILYPELSDTRPKERVTLAEIIAGHYLVDMDVLEYFFERGNIALDSDESFPVHTAVINKDNKKFDYLYEKSFDKNGLNTKNYQKYFEQKLTPADGDGLLHLAISYDNAYAFKKLINDPEIDVNLNNTPRKETPLMFAAYFAIYNMKYEKDDYMFKQLIAHTDIDVNKAAMDETSTYINMFSLYLEINQSFNSKEQKYLIKDVINHPRFDARLNCPKDSQCLGAVIRVVPFEIFKLYEPLAEVLDYESKIYKFNGKSYDIISFVQAYEKVSPNKSDISRILSLLKKWKSQYSKS